MTTRTSQRPSGRRRRPAGAAGLGTSQTVLPLDPSNDPRHRPMRDRRSRHDLRRELRSVTRIKRLKGCGNAIGQTVGVKYDAGAGAGFSGIETCGSIWGCPVCAAKIAARRAIELEQLLSWATAPAQGYSVAMVTLTVRHHSGDRLKDVWDAINKGWAAITSGRAWLRIQDAVGFVGWVKAVEVTHGRNGWHVHIHALMIMEHPERADMLRDHMWLSWVRGIDRVGYTALRDLGGFDFTMSAGGDSTRLGKYIAKMGNDGAQDLGALAREATHGQAKSGRLGGRTPFQVLAWGITTGDMDDLDVWREWERDSRRRQFMRWSKGLRDLAAMDAEATDEEVAAEEAGGDFVLALPRSTYRALQAYGLECDLLDLVELHGDGLAASVWLDAHGLAWSPPPERP
jgi:hypothetical protein